MSDDFFGKVFGQDASKLGTQAIINPAATGSGSRGDLVRLLRLNTQDERAAVMVNFNLRSEISLSNPIVSADGVTIIQPAGTFGALQIGGPLVARLTWGVGGAYQVMEFDIPPPRLDNVTPIANQDPVPLTGGGVTVCVSGSSFQLDVRNDSALAPLNGGAGIFDNTNSPAKVLASVSPGSGSVTGPLRRTIYAVKNTNTLGAGANLPEFMIPPFATAAWFYRNPSATTPLGITTRNDQSITITRAASITANGEGPLSLGPNETRMIVQNQGAVAISSMVIVFEIQPN
jgi:hypothetical protein